MLKECFHVEHLSIEYLEIAPDTFFFFYCVMTKSFIMIFLVEMIVLKW
jgi:hypothetical protein